MFIWLYKSTSGTCVQSAATLVLFLALFSDVYAMAEPDKKYLRIQQSQSSETNDLEISSIGALVFTEDGAGHLDLTYIQSDIHGDLVGLDFGGGYVFNWDLSLYLGLGVSLGYNGDKEDFNASYYPEASIILDITSTFGISAAVKRYQHLYGEKDTIVMLGLVFR